MKNALIGLILIAYPFIIYFGLAYVAPTILAVFLASLFIFRHIKQRKNKNKPSSTIPHTNILLINVLSLLAYTGLTNSEFALKLYPVVVNLSFFIIFTYSLFRPPSVVEIIARLKENLNEEGIVYTRKVTIIWCVFFVTNGAIAAWTIFQPNPQYWLLYNGLISYILMGLLMALEFAYRRLKVNHSDNSQNVK